GCISAPVIPGARTCFVTTDTEDPMRLGVYEQDPAGPFVLTHTLHIPNWSWTTDVTTADVIRTRTDAFVIKAIGMHGTGIIQRMRLVIGWNGHAFAPMAIESLSYECVPPTSRAHDKLDVRDSFQFIAKEQPGLRLRYTLTRDGAAVGTWTDLLGWQPN